MYMLSISVFYYASALSNVFGGVRRINSNDLSTIKLNFTIPDLLYTLIMFVLTFLCVFLEENIYYNTSIIAICAFSLLKREKFFDFMCNKFNEKRYDNLAKYRE